jgi:DNA mismatch repair protein MutL
VNRIRILPEAVANKIAAGEVVERPASACKELIENSLDAGAGKISIEVRGGGRSLIRVTDDGFGMSRDDALLCLERHATSKIKTASDIDQIQTLGFRGEAVPSLAAVSKFRLLTREADMLEGTEIETDGGKIRSVRAAGCPAGTQVEMRQLFFNVPARKKFLRSEPTELAHIHQLGILYALAHPRVQWVLRHNDRTLLEAPPAQGLGERVRTLFGREVHSQLVPVEHDQGGIRVHGFTAKPGFTRSHRRELHFFVNRRPVDSRAIYYGLLEGYHNALMKGKFPITLIFVEIDPARVDVNIHPAKREVRFRDESSVQAGVAEAVGTALGKLEGRPVAVSAGRPFGYAPSAAAEPQVRESLPIMVDAGTRGRGDAAIEVVSEPTLDIGLGTLDIPKVHGIVNQLYILAENRGGLVIVDQHAAHERILYERLLDQVAKKAAPSQKLLLPQTVDLNPADFQFLKEQIPMLERMGFGISEFGKNSLMIDALPPHLPPENLGSLFRAVCDALREAGRGVGRERFREDVIAKTVCRAAVKANDGLKMKEAERLLADLVACRQPYCCPHGRPTMIQVTNAELEKKFGRRV